MCELLHTRTPGIASHYVFSCCLRGDGMNNLSQPPQPTEPDMALLYFGSLFETLDYTLPPERDEAKLDALAWHILDKRPKTLLGLAIRARAEKHLCRYLWTVDFERLPPSDQAARNSDRQTSSKNCSSRCVKYLTHWHGASAPASDTIG